MLVRLRRLGDRLLRIGSRPTHRPEERGTINIKRLGEMRAFFPLGRVA